MKFTLPITLLAIATSVDAAAVEAATQQDKRWCALPGQACDTVKRAADAFAAAVRSTEGAALSARDESADESYHMARSQADQLAAIIAASQGDPFAYYNALKYAEYGDDEADEATDNTATATTAEKRDLDRRWCNFLPGQPCWKRSDTVEKRDPRGWCRWLPGQPCWKRSDEVEKREAEAVPRGWCSWLPGQPCWKRSDEVEKRDAEAVPRGWCSFLPGQPCWKRCEGESCGKVKRAAEAVMAAIDAGNANFEKRDAEAEIEARWCKFLPGQPCWKRAAEAEAACNGPDGACIKAARDLHAMYSAARSIVEAN